MCCFSRDVESVTDTRIFARDSTSPLQFLVYEMVYSASQDLAMILPIPVPARTPENGVRFISLEKYPTFFADLDSGFPKPKTSRNLLSFGGDQPAASPLAVVEVGAYEASFVPKVADFSRLDERFRLPTTVWNMLPQYKMFGFAVFKLKKETQKPHPMAFEFPRVNPRQLFFPTIHIHDGQVHAKAEFDHTLYAQFSRGHRIAPQLWNESPQPAGMFMNMPKCEGLLEKGAHAYKRTIRGTQKNEDVVA